MGSTLACSSFLFCFFEFLKGSGMTVKAACSRSTICFDHIGIYAQNQFGILICLMDYRPDIDKMTVLQMKEV